MEMAKPIEFRPAPQGTKMAAGTREKAEQHLRDAPAEHAEALLAAYALLQQLHDSGMLDLMRGGISAGGKIVSEVSGALVQPEAIRGIRNLVLISKTFATVDPAALERLVKVLPSSEAQLVETKPPSFFSLMRRMFSADARRGLAVGLAAVEALGKAAVPQPK